MHRLTTCGEMCFSHVIFYHDLGDPKLNCKLHPAGRFIDVKRLLAF